MADDELVAIMTYLEGIEPKFSTPAKVKNAIENWAMSTGKDNREKKAFLNEVSDAGSVHDALLQCLKFCGKKICDNAFN